MKKTVLLAVLPLILVVLGCSKSDTASSCTYGADALKGKLYKLQSEIVDTGGVRFSTKTFNDSSQFSYSFSDGTTGILIVKAIVSGQSPIEYTKKIDYTVLAGSNDLQIVEWNSSTSKNTYLYKVESFDCNKMVLYSKGYSYYGSSPIQILFERRETYIKQ
jgi:hypothetical protein